jgi:hypothetical protein
LAASGEPGHGAEVSAPTQRDDGDGRYVGVTMHPVVVSP